MATNLGIDDKLLVKALQISGSKTKKDTVNLALLEFIQRREKEKVIDLFNTINYDESYNYKDERRDERRRI